MSSNSAAETDLNSCFIHADTLETDLFVLRLMLICITIQCVAASLKNITQATQL